MPGFKVDLDAALRASHGPVVARIEQSGALDAADRKHVVEWLRARAQSLVAPKQG